MYHVFYPVLLSHINILCVFDTSSAINKDFWLEERTTYHVLFFVQCIYDRDFSGTAGLGNFSELFLMKSSPKSRVYFPEYITMTNIQSKIDLLKQRAIDLEVENAKLKQIIKENAKRKADNVNLSAKNGKVKIELRRAMGENAKLKAESLREVKTRERIEKTMLELDGCLYRKSLSMK
ncbi:hypothetical protein Glove_46g1 [Diversispora epigaea]|uniref:Uncharacterized protein n=1 Tax=Diversispora epigaea TaxID=1348612 RepID=A0A397JPA6_9GLOM|nr:hypothetical protein Glove_46g1 [Diversispora epigaea]